jgi:mannose-6-phosphate isomerase-like protein (cupin superfamily)
MASTNFNNEPPGVRDESRRTLTNKVVKDIVFFEKYGSETNGECTRVRVQVKPQGGTPIHYHRSYAEQFFPTQGILGVVLGTQTLNLPPGESAIVPIGTYHRFFNPSTTEDCSFVGEARPSHEGFERGLYIIYGLANDGLCDEEGTPKSIMHLSLIADMSDMFFPGLMGSIGLPFLKAMAAYGRWSGEEERLLKLYWY